MVWLTGMMLFVPKLFPSSDRIITFRREQSEPINWRGVGWDLTKIVLGGILVLMFQRIFTAPPGPGASQPSIVQPEHPTKGDAAAG